ncbi:MAG: membrane dipeptidase [Lewinellaceae bacterium]|nr:membrane dipeptidase [Lewinellaceae bacterium]
MNNLSKVAFLAFIAFFFSFSKASAQPSEARLHKKADKLAHKFIITDGHVDLPYRLKVQNFRLEREYIGIPIETDKGDFDYVRAKKGGLDAPFMSIYIPSSYQDGRAKLLADSLIEMVQGIIQAYPDKFAPGRSPAEINANFKKGLVSLPMGMENGAPIEGDLKNVQYFFDRGIRYITLTHAKDNHICDSSYDTTHTWNGLSPFGREVVQEMNKVGIMVDVSHVSDSTFWQVMEITAAPCIASHSSCRKYTPGFERNMNDEMIRRMAQNGGVIQINFGTDFLDGALSAQNDHKREELRALLAKEGLEYDSPDAAPLIEQFRKDNPTLFADVQLVADHIGHVVELAGIDHVGLGSDFDGVGDSLPTGLKDVSQYPNLVYELLRRGYSEEDIAKVCYKNVWRVWQEVEQVAEKM